MKRLLPILISSCAVAVACQSAAPTPDAQQTQPPPREASSPPEAAPKDEPAERESPIMYHFRDGVTRAYLPLTSPICEEDATARPRYEIVALWRFDAEADQWSSLDVAADQPYRIECNAMLDLINILGFDLEPATYAIAAKVDGKLERDVFNNGEASCDDVDTGAAPEGKVALCIVGESSAEARIVPDPADLEL
ncbi:MAG: hypothetical protein ACLFVJ_02485 [Persicimonas sp.]